MWHHVKLRAACLSTTWAASTLLTSLGPPACLYTSTPCQMAAHLLADRELVCNSFVLFVTLGMTACMHIELCNLAVQRVHLLGNSVLIAWLLCGQRECSAPLCEYKALGVAPGAGRGSMQFIGPNLVVLDCRATIAVEYENHSPLHADFSLPAPYQTPKDDETAAGSEDGLDGETTPEEVGGGWQGLATAPAAAELPTVVPAAQPAGRKRQRKSSYAPNTREQQAAARHAEYAPQLAAAAAAVRAWLRAQGAATLQQALGDPAAHAGPCQADLQRAVGRQVSAGVHGSARGGTGSSRQLAAGCGEAKPPPGEGQDPDYRAMWELRHALKPKLQLAASPPDATMGARQPQDALQPPANLFDRLFEVTPSPCPPVVPGGAAGHAGNLRDGSEQVAWAAGHPMVLPPRSRFLLSDVRRLEPLLGDAEGAGRPAPRLPKMRLACQSLRCQPEPAALSALAVKFLTGPHAAVVVSVSMRPCSSRRLPLHTARSTLGEQERQAQRALPHPALPQPAGAAASAPHARGAAARALLLCYLSPTAAAGLLNSRPCPRCWPTLRACSTPDKRLCPLRCLAAAHAPHAGGLPGCDVGHQPRAAPPLHRAG